MNTRRVLVIEDDPDIGRLVTLQLAELGFEHRLVADGVTGLAEAEGGRWDLLILDLMLPRLDGLQICKRLRSRGEGYLPILMLTAKSSELDRVLGLELGADDYLVKPFSMLELAARVKAILRRQEHFEAATAAAPAATLIEAGELRIDLDRHEVLVSGRAVDLTAKEFELLVYFARAPGRVFTRAQLLDQVWGYTHSGYEHTVNSHINRLRNKIERDPAQPAHIQTVWGVGYRFASQA